MNRIKSLAVTVLGVVVYAVTLAMISPAQNQPSLVITAPSDGSVYAPGQTVSVTVQAVGSFQAVTVFAHAPLQSDNVLGSPPYTFPVKIPATASPGPYAIRALGSVSPGNSVQSPPLTIQVENPNPVVSLKADLSQLTFRFIGDQIPILVTGTFSDGSSAILSNSQGTSYTSNNSNVVTINSVGLSTATGGGNADIVVHYSALSIDIPVSVPQTIRGDLDGDGDVDQDDLNIILESLNTPATRPLDARDLNGDGIIDALDARILVNLCTRPHCATR